MPEIRILCWTFDASSSVSVSPAAASSAAPDQRELGDAEPLPAAQVAMERIFEVAP
jgi:hypothetical protein